MDPFGEDLGIPTSIVVERVKGSEIPEDWIGVASVEVRADSEEGGICIILWRRIIAIATYLRFCTDRCVAC